MPHTVEVNCYYDPSPKKVFRQKELCPNFK